MEYLTLIKPFLMLVTFTSLAVSILAGVAGDLMGEGFRFGYRRPRPDTRLGRWLLVIERAGLAICLTSIALILGSSFFT